MLFRIGLPFITDFEIVLSRSEDCKNVGWAIILLNHKSILIDPTCELKNYCRGDETVEFSSDICLKKPHTHKFNSIKIYHSCYHQKPYLYLTKSSSEESGGLLFTMGLEDYAKIIKQLKPTLVLTREGQVLRQGEAYLTSLLK